MYSINREKRRYDFDVIQKFSISEGMVVEVKMGLISFREACIFALLQGWMASAGSGGF
jgi:hypothetical protein